uniref:Uncharacterized protein n=1 Tax=Panagrolaimus sp. PS1159 TaxID=55785 RepID=A0AC35EYL3_9BILA
MSKLVFGIVLIAVFLCVIYAHENRELNLEETTILPEPTQTPESDETVEGFRFKRSWCDYVCQKKGSSVSVPDKKKCGC